MTKRHPIVAFLKDLMYHGIETMGRYYSSYRGIVVDNADPLNLQRVQLIIPEVGGSNPYKYWAHAKGAFNGTGYGTQMIPQKGELVWVEFERGHPEVPIYSLGHMGNGDIPTDDSELVDPNCYWLITPGGMKVKLNDTKKTLTITVNGATIIINPTGQFTIQNQQTDLKIVLEDMMSTYLQTLTMMGDTLGPDSMNDAVNNIKEINKLFL